MKLNEVLSKTIQFFKEKKFDTARLDAELLISHALKIPRIQLYVKFDAPLTEAELTLCRDSVRRRTAGEPVAYITEEKGFYGLMFKVKSGVLIPRPETEMIIDEVLAHHKKFPKENIRILDLGAGTGCIGLTLLKNIPTAHLVSVEKSEIAFSVVKENAETLQVMDRCELLHQDVNTLDWEKLGKFDYLVSNPPYIDTNDSAVEINVRKYEPAEALFAVDRGFSFLKHWSTKAAALLNSPGLILFEMGASQGAEMKKHFLDLAPLISDVEVLKDLSGLDRIIKARA